MQTWIENNLQELQSSGFTEKDIFHRYWPTGIANLNLWQKPDLEVQLKPGQLSFSWRNLHGKTIYQKSKPERKKNEREITGRSPAIRKKHHYQS